MLHYSIQIQRDIVVIPKSVNPKRIEENFAVLDFTISDEDMKILNGFNRKDGRLIEMKLNGKVRDIAHPDYPFKADVEF